MSQWFLIQSKPKQELRAKENLENQGVSCFLPMVELEKVIRGKRQKVQETLFKNYLFIQLSDGDNNWSKIRSTRGVRDFVRFGSQLAKVPTSLIQQLQSDLEQFDNKLLDSNAPQVGEKVYITAGAFKGLEGIYQAKSGEERSIILLNLLNKRVKIDLSNQDVIKAEN